MPDPDDNPDREWLMNVGRAELEALASDPDEWARTVRPRLWRACGHEPPEPSVPDATGRRRLFLNPITLTATLLLWALIGLTIWWLW